ncbi:hypothetical protein [Treponema pedis]|uniref:Uncharacterized protein n=2 Tax=Treponema pedis TaxID=409322 RepID=S5ZR32_9SPIR|nr:hypothetical protein [Treponema pedis]AGT45132.1 hypothetical protein TPE_2660 [Treponema pedis str. T A4]QOW60390.1 hypothetical protein IFE08_11300 [Treponema pedis]QSI05732.1 hypothetical protein DYQ05_12870 [Treponema pedis]
MEHNKKFINVLFRIEKANLFEKLLVKLKNFDRYCAEENIDAHIEIVCAGDIVNNFRSLNNELIGTGYDVALCKNALGGDEINYKNVRTVRAGIGEIIVKKSQGYVEYTIE